MFDVTGFFILTTILLLAGVATQFVHSIAASTSHAIELAQKQISLQRALADHAIVSNARVKLEKSLNAALKENERLAGLIQYDGKICEVDAFSAYHIHAARPVDITSPQPRTVFIAKPKQEWSFSFTAPWDVSRAKDEWPVTCRAMARRFGHEIYGLTRDDWASEIEKALLGVEPL